MIPDKHQVNTLWDKYHLPEQKRIHCSVVARVAVFFAEQINKVTNSQIDKTLLNAAAMLHDIDKSVPRLAGERHPDTAVRVLRSEGMDEVANLVATHALHAILDPAAGPKTWEQKLLFLADKMVKYEVLTVDKRFDLWRAEDMPPHARDELDAAYPKVKELEREVCDRIGIRPEDVAKLVTTEYNHHT